MSNKQQQNNTIVKIPIHLLHDDLWDARDTTLTESKAQVEKRVNSLARSIKQNGLTNPILVAQIPNKTKKGHYSVVAGRLRLRAHKKLGLKTIDCIITQETNPSKLAMMTFSENHERMNLTLDEEINGLVKYFKDGGYSPDQVRQLAKKIHNQGSTKDIPEKFKKLVESMPPVNDNVPQPNFLSQIMQTVLQIDPQVKEEIRKHNLNLDKRIMLTHSKIRDHPRLQIMLIRRIEGLTHSKARLAVAQIIRDLETKAILKTKEGNYVYDGDKREPINESLQLEKTYMETYFDLVENIKSVIFNLTGHKITRGESKYEKSHIEKTELYRIQLAKNLTEPELMSLESDLLVLNEAVQSFMYLIGREVLNVK